METTMNDALGQWRAAMRRAMRSRTDAALTAACDTLDRVEEAARSIPCRDARDVWARVAMALERLPDPDDAVAALLADARAALADG